MDGFGLKKSFQAWRKLTKEQRAALTPELREAWRAEVRAYQAKCVAKKMRKIANRSARTANPEHIAPIVDRVMADIMARLS